MKDLIENLNLILGGGGILSVIAFIYYLGRFHNRFEKLEKSNSEFRIEMKELRVDFNREIKDFRTEMKELRVDFNREMKDLRTEMKEDLREFKTDIKEILHTIKVDLDDLKRKKAG